ncbi:MAG: hypothetical protein HXY30_08230 [Pseudorhodoplanes sp.]|nr:hypothetical protein [Pseudorhodoplanes sp.]
MTDLMQPVVDNVTLVEHERGGAPVRILSAARPWAIDKEDLRRAAAVRDTVEFEIVPRLVLACGLKAHQQAANFPAPGVVSHDEVDAFTRAVLGRDQDAAYGYINAELAKGRTLEKIYVELIAPSARHLRQLWADDVCDFAEATLALWRLQQLLRDFSAAFRSEGAQHSTGLRALLAPGPGEKQELGYLMFELVLVGEFFRRDGWDAWIEPDSTGKGFTQVVKDQWFDVVEFLVSGDKRLDALAARISAVRKDSPNHSVRVLVCGPAFTKNPELVLAVGGDGPAADPGQGIGQANYLVGLPLKRD